MQFSFTLSTINQVAKAVWQAGKTYRIWAFHGEMGAGKTTFIHALCEVLGVTSVIGSPTYAIINEYGTATNESIFHMDWYRLAGEQEAMEAGVEDTLYSGKLCLVEWPEKAEAILPLHTLHLHLGIASATERTIKLDLPRES